MEGSDPRTDGELLVATRGDPDAFAVFYRRHVRGVLAFFSAAGVDCGGGVGFDRGDVRGGAGGFGAV
jgi:hypothetical protein